MNGFHRGYVGFLKPSGIGKKYSRKGKYFGNL